MKKASIRLPLADFGCALELSSRFNLSSGVRPRQRVETVLSQALHEMQPLAEAIRAGGRVEAGYHSGSWDILTLENGREQAVSQEQTARRAGKAAVSLSATGARYLATIRNTFQLSNDGRAATLAVRIYARILDNLWRGNHLTVWDKNDNQVPYDTERLKGIVAAQSPA